MLEFDKCEISASQDSVMDIGMKVHRAGLAKFSKITASNAVCVTMKEEGVTASCFVPPATAPAPGPGTARYEFVQLAASSSHAKRGRTKTT